MRAVGRVGADRAGLVVLLPRVLELEVGLTEGADDAVFGGGAGINRQRHTGTGGEVIA